MELVIISGASNSGKTGAIKHTIKYFLELEETRIVYVSCFRSNENRYNCKKEYLLSHINTSIEIGLHSDRNIGLVILEYKGSIIGISTYGDSLPKIKGYLNTSMNVTEYNLDVFVCGRHDNNEPLREFAEWINDFKAENVIPSKGIKNGSDEDKDRANAEKGKKLFDRIMKIIQ